MIDTSWKFVIDNTDIKLQKCVLFVTTGTTFSNNVLSYMSFAMSSKYFKFAVQISSKYIQLYDGNFAKA